jgi:isoquinoline 1-oxidoreductase beta subunit
MKPRTGLPTLDTQGISRRAFLAASGTLAGGLLLTVRVPIYAAPIGEEAASADFGITLYARIAPSGAVTLIAPNPEMGQGIKTSLPMIFAEELGIAWKDVVGIQMADYMGGKMGGQVSGGSLSTLFYWAPLRKAGAAGRQMFIRAAAQTWRVPEDQCRAADSAVTHVPSGRVLRYGELASAAAELPVPDLEQVQLKDESTFSIVGRPVADPDKTKVVVGHPIFGIDFKLPGMKYAVYQKSPVFDAEVKSANLDEVRALPGVSHVLVFSGGERQLEGPNTPGVLIDDALRPGVAIVADTWWHAQQARSKLKVEWNEGAHAEDSTQGFAAQAEQLFAQAPHTVVRTDGAPEHALSTAAKILTANYSYPFLSHSPLEPQNCVASFQDGKLEVWAPTQSPGAGRTQVSKLLGIPPENVTIHMLRCGGAFGRRLANDPMYEAAVVSRAIGAPVKVLWSREDDMQHDFYRPGGFHKLAAGLDGNGRLIAWSNHFVGFARTQWFNRISAPPPEMYPAGLIPNYSLKTSRIPFNVPVGPLRAPADNAPAFVYQSFMDELAHAAGRDPVDFQLELLRNAPPAKEPTNVNLFQPARLIPVIEKVRTLSGWAKRHQLPHGTGMGFACYWSHRGYVAQVQQVRVDKDGSVHPQRVWVVVDIGRHVVNPLNAENQVQGSVIDGLSVAFGQQITLDKGRVVQSNFHNYPLLRNVGVPSVEVQFILTDYQPTGLGEPVVPSTPPALCNAIFAASGRRVRTLPLSAAAGTAKS